MIIQFSCKNCVKSSSLWFHSKKIALTIWLSSFAMHILFWALTLTQGIWVKKKKKKKDFRPTDPTWKCYLQKGNTTIFFLFGLIVRYTSIEVVIRDGKWKTLTPKASQDPNQTVFLPSFFDKDMAHFTVKGPRVPLGFSILLERRITILVCWFVRTCYTELTKCI